MRILDCHSDLMVDVFSRRRSGRRDVLRSEYVDDLRAGGVAGLVVTVGGDTANLSPLGRDRPFDSVVAVLEALHAEAVEARGELAVVGSAAELLAAMDRGAVALLPALEGASPVRGGVAGVRRLYELGVRQIGLTWNSRNELATGLGQGDGGLTDAGVRAVAAMNRLGVVVDVSHSSPRTVQDVARCSTAPFVASHSNARTLCDHPRNLDDAQLAAIADADGVVCATLYPDFVSAGTSSLADVARHVGYLLGHVGARRVGFGADLTYFMRDRVAASVRGSGVGYRRDPTWPSGVDTYATLCRLPSALAAAGIPDAVVEDVTWRSYLDLLRRVEHAADRG